MKIAFFSTQPYDQQYFERYNKQHQIIFFDAPLNEQTVELAKCCDAICAFVNDKLNAALIKDLATMGIKLIAQRVPVIIM